MLVLKRKIGETVMLGDQISVQVLGIEGDTIKLGFVAPQEVQIMRLELYDSIKEENKNAGEQMLDKQTIIELLGKSFDQEK